MMLEAVDCQNNCVRFLKMWSLDGRRGDKIFNFGALAANVVHHVRNKLLLPLPAKRFRVFPPAPDRSMRMHRRFRNK